MFENLENIDIIDLIEYAQQIFKTKEDAEEILNYINIVFFDKVKTNAKYIECMKIVEDTKNRLKKNNNFDMSIDNFVMTVWEVVNG